MKRSHLGITIASALVLCAPLLTGCSSAGDSTGGTTTSATADTNTIRIGLEAPLTGSQKELGVGMLRGASMAAVELNAAGGILGKKIVIVPIDDQADPEIGAAAAAKAITSGLDGIVGPYNSGVGIETLPLYIEAGLVPLRLTSADTTSSLGFTLQPMTSQIAPVATNAISKWLGAKSAAIIFDSTTEYTKNAAAEMSKLLTAAGISLTLSEPITPGATSYASTVAKVAATKPELIYIVTYFPEGGLIAREMFDSRTPARCLADYGAYDNGFITAAGITAARHCPIVGVPAPGDFTNSAARVATFRKLYSAAPGAWSPYTYDSVKLLAEKAEEAGGFSAEQLTAALAATSGWTGWTGGVAFEMPTGNRTPAPVTVNITDAKGAFHVDTEWMTATGFAF